MYLCFIKFYIKFGVFHIAGHEPTRRTIGPRAFWLTRPENRPMGRAWAVRQARWPVEAQPGDTRTIRPVLYLAVPTRCSYLGPAEVAPRTSPAPRWPKPISRCRVWTVEWTRPRLARPTGHAPSPPTRSNPTPYLPAGYGKLHCNHCHGRRQGCAGWCHRVASPCL